MNPRIHLVAERLWGVIALVALCFSLFQIGEIGWDAGRSTLIFPGIAGAWYFTRRGMRKRLTRDESSPDGA